MSGHGKGGKGLGKGGAKCHHKDFFFFKKKKKKNKFLHKNEENLTSCYCPSSIVNLNYIGKAEMPGF